MSQIFIVHPPAFCLPICLCPRCYADFCCLCPHRYAAIRYLFPSCYAAVCCHQPTAPADAAALSFVAIGTRFFLSPFSLSPPSRLLSPLPLSAMPPSAAFFLAATPPFAAIALPPQPPPPLCPLSPSPYAFFVSLLSFPP